jgi:hypothetical protein
MLAQNNLNEADLCRSLNIRQLEDMTASQVANALSSGPSTYLNTSHA